MAMSKGCTVALIIVAAILVIVIIGFILVWLNKDKIVEAGLNYMTQTAEQEIVKNLPDGYTPESVHQVMEDLKVAIREGRVSNTQVQELASTYQTVMADKQIDKDEGVRLLALIQDVLGQTPPAPQGESPAAVPDTTSSIPDTGVAIPDSV